MVSLNQQLIKINNSIATLRTGTLVAKQIAKLELFKYPSFSKYKTPALSS